MWIRAYSGATYYESQWFKRSKLRGLDTPGNIRLYFDAATPYSLQAHNPKDFEHPEARGCRAEWARTALTYILSMIDNDFRLNAARTVFFKEIFY